jgi:hypothetical protein
MLLTSENDQNRPKNSGKSSFPAGKLRKSMEMEAVF